MKTILLLSLSLLLWQGCTQKHDESEHSNHENVVETYYTCSMHPQVREKEPGKCPICHMNLSKVEIEKKTTLDEHANHKEVSEPLWACRDDHSVTSPSPTTCPLDGEPMVELNEKKEGDDVVMDLNLTASQVTHFHAALFEVSNMQMIKEVRLLGEVIQAQEKESNIPLRIDGRIEYVYIKSEGEYIRRGQAVVDIYSPTLISAGEEYIIARRQVNESSSNKNFQELLKQTEERLNNWGITKKQREDWVKSGVVGRTITIYSPTSGIVRSRNAVKGKYLTEGQILFSLVDLSKVWVELDVYEVDAALVELGQKISLRFSALPGTEIEGVLDFVSPVIDSRTRTLKARATLDNQEGVLKIGMVADGRLSVELSDKSLVVPRAAIVDTGKRKIVWLKKSERQYEARLVRTGHIAGDYIQILSGLQDGDMVVTKGNFLLDAQAQLFGGQSGHQH